MRNLKGAEEMEVIIEKIKKERPNLNLCIKNYHFRVKKRRNDNNDKNPSDQLQEYETSFASRVNTFQVN